MTCKICTERSNKKLVEIKPGKKRRICDGCSKPISVYRSMDGNGFQSHTVDHVHQMIQLNDASKRLVIEDPIMKELCYECYVADFKKAYPNLPLPQIANVETD